MGAQYSALMLGRFLGVALLLCLSCAQESAADASVNAEVEANDGTAETEAFDDVAAVRFFSWPYAVGSSIMLAGVVLPFGYMLMQNKKTLMHGYHRA